MTDVDRKDHSTNFVKGKMRKVVDAHEEDVGVAVDESTKEFVGWYRKRARRNSRDLSQEP